MPPPTVTLSAVATKIKENGGTTAPVDKQNSTVVLWRSTEIHVRRQAAHSVLPRPSPER